MGFTSSVSKLPEQFRRALLMIGDANKINEIRLRVGKYLTVSYSDGEKFVDKHGGVWKFPNSSCIQCSADIVRESFMAVCEYSFHSYQEDIRQGYITLCGGDRVGIVGTCVCDGESVSTVKNISSMNIRISREILGCADGILNKMQNEGLCSCIIAGVPGSGKTTVLRDLSRLLSDKSGKRVCIADDRCEIAAIHNCVPTYNTGLFSDVLSGYPKATAIETAIRTMSPDFIICDELGNLRDIEAVKNGMNCGVRFIVTVHAGSVQEVLEKKYKHGFLKYFGLIIMLSDKSRPGEISESVSVSEVLIA